MNMKIIITIFVFLTLSLSLYSQVIVKKDNGEAAGNAYNSSRQYWEESSLLTPDGPCKILKIQVYLTGFQKSKDTLRIVGYPTAGNLYPTQYIWHFNMLVEPIIFDYDGVEGWKEFDISDKNLRSDGFDKIVIQHLMRPEGPWFAFDGDGRNSQDISWMTDPYTPNPNFYNIIGTIFAYPGGDYMLRFVVEYDYPSGGSSLPPPPPTLVNANSELQINAGGYPSVVDINNDSWDDLELGSKYFINNKRGSFTENTKLGIEIGNTTWGDINNDGFIDVFVSKGWNNDMIYMNNGNISFSDITAATQISNNYPTDTPLWLDANNDGLLDLFIANRRKEENGQETFYPDQLWVQQEDGSFENVTQSSGIAAGEPSPYFDCYGACATDFNNDNKADIFVANYRLAKDNLFKNNGDDTFAEVAAQTGVQGVPTSYPQYFGHGMGAQWSDYNNDGYPDLAVGNLAHTDSRGLASNPSLIFKNNGPPDYNFTETHMDMGLKFHEGNAGMCWLDLDLDGYLDLWHGKYSGGIGAVYLNQGPPDFKLKEVTWLTSGIVNNPWVGVRWDFDHDGDLDLICNSTILRNDMPRNGNFVTFRLSGDPTDNVNMDAYGSKVIVYSGNKKFYRELYGSAAGSRCTQNSNEIHFGVGKVKTLDSVVVIYSNGKSKSYSNVETNRRYKINYMGELTSSGLAAPELIYPTNFQTNIEADTDFDFLFSVSKGADEYKISLTDFEGNILTSLELYNIEPDTHGNISLKKNLPCGYYKWNVEASNDSERVISSTYAFSVCAPMPDKLKLTFPYNGDIELSARPILRWDPAEYKISYGIDTKYQIQLSKSTEFDQIAVDLDDITDLEYRFTTPLDAGATYYWRVRALNQGVPGKWADYWSFTIKPLPAKLKLVSPKNEETGVELNPRLSWEKPDFSDGVQVLLASDEAFTNIVFDMDKVVLSSTKVKESLEPLTKYWWIARGFNEGGEGEWSETWNFTTESGVGVEEPIIPRLNIIISPNPSTGDQLSIIITSEETENCEIKIIDLSGNEIISVFEGILPAGSNHFDINKAIIPQGTYFVRAIKGDKSYSEKFILTK